MFTVFNDIEDATDAEVKIAQGSVQLPVLSLRGVVICDQVF